MLQLVQQPALRGAEVFAKQLSAALRKRGHSTRTVYLYAASDARLPVEPDDRVLGASPGHPLERAFVQPGVVSRLGAVLDEFRPDVLQLNGGRAVKYGAALRHLRRREPWVDVYRNIGDPSYWVRGRAKRFLYRFGVFSGVDGIVALSEQSGRAFRETFGVAVPIEVIPTGVSPEDLVPAEERAALRRRLAAPVDAPVALYVGSLAPEKRLDRLISAFSGTLGAIPEARLWIVGEGPERRTLEGLAKERGLDTCLSFVGATRDVASYYRAADAFVLTSDTEGIPGVLLEAAYMGLPVVATDVGLVRECVLDGESALLAEPTAASVGAALTRLLRDGDLRRRLGERGHSLAEERFLMADVARRYELFYRRVRDHARRKR